jgi:hypothetical protein
MLKRKNEQKVNRIRLKKYILKQKIMNGNQAKDYNLDQ